MPVINHQDTFRPLGFERVYLPLYKVADTPFHIKRDDFIFIILFYFYFFLGKIKMHIIYILALELKCWIVAQLTL